MLANLGALNAVLPSACAMHSISAPRVDPTLRIRSNVESIVTYQSSESTKEVSRESGLTRVRGGTEIRISGWAYPTEKVFTQDVGIAAEFADHWVRGYYGIKRPDVAKLFHSETANLTGFCLRLELPSKSEIGDLRVYILNTNHNATLIAKRQFSLTYGSE